MAAAKDPVDLGLRIPDAGLEVLDQPAQDDKELHAPGWETLEAPSAVDPGIDRPLLGRVHGGQPTRPPAALPYTGLAMTNTGSAQRRTSVFLRRMWIVMAVFAGLVMLQLVAPQLFPTGAEIVVKIGPNGQDQVALIGSSVAEQGATYVIPYREGGRYTITLGVRNTGPVTVKLTGVNTSIGGELSRQAGVQVGASAGTLAALHSYPLDPGKSAILLITQVMSGCRSGSAPTSATMSLLGVTATAIGVGRTVPIDLARPIRIEAAATCAAPA